MLIGNLGKDPEVRRLDNGTAVARFSLATNENYKDKNGERQTHTEWHSIIAWRRLAEIAEQYLKKGSMVYVEGRLTTRSYTDQNGDVKYTTEVVAYTFKMLDRKDGSGQRHTTPLPTEEIPGVTQSNPENAIENLDSPQKLDASTSEDQPNQSDDDLPF